MAGGSLPTISGSRVVRALTRNGFVADRIVGSHHVLVHPNAYAINSNLEPIDYTQFGY